MLEAAWISDTSDQIHTFAPPLAFHVQVTVPRLPKLVALRICLHFPISV